VTETVYALGAAAFDGNGGKIHGFQEHFGSCVRVDQAAEGSDDLCWCHTSSSVKGEGKTLLEQRDRNHRAKGTF